MNRIIVLCILVVGLMVTGVSHEVVWALDESELTPTSKKVVAAEDDEFNAAMRVWNSHKYHDGEQLLRKFAKKHPESRWAAEAELHVGCGLVYKKQFGEARQIFESIVRRYPDSQMEIKAKIRLGNIWYERGRKARLIPNS